MTTTCNCRLLYCLTVLSLLLAGCEWVNPELRMHVAEYRQFDPERLQTIFEEQSFLRLTAAEGPPGRAALQVLADADADLGLVENSTAFVPGIRAGLPVSESVLHILVSDEFRPHKMSSPLREASFSIPHGSSAGRSFVELVTSRQGMDADDYRISSTFEPGDTDVVVYFGPINPDVTNWYPQGYTLVSLDNPLIPQRQFFHEGIGYTAPNMKPKTIPALTYDLPGNEDDLLTVAVDTLLVARKDVSVGAVFELTRTFLSQKPRFAAVAPHLFSGINESFDPLDLSFPLHDGARRYLERDEPGLLERYAETINMLVYVTFLLISAAIGFARWRAHRKKDRIDTFYVRVMGIRDRMGREDSALLLEELEALEREAFESLIKEKLAANESFRIFTDLMARLRAELKAGL